MKLSIDDGRLTTGVNRILLLTVCVVFACSLSLDAQRVGGRGRAGGPPQTPRQAAPIDLAGYWVSPIVEDWKYRMVTPAKGVFDARTAQRRGPQARRELGSGEG
jgi:hypothetical protein